ncbi:MAG: response regulator transcription factor [Muribaculaceae bacterium]|nr:response regulator transcription factor [Muribaculaceae bacterium]
MASLRNGGNKDQFRMKQENELKSLLTDQQFEASDNREGLLAQAKACANNYALATEGIAVISDFQNNECHIYSGKFGQTIMNLPEYMVDRNSAFEDIIFCHAKKDDLIERHVLELRFFNFIKELSINDKTNFSASCLLRFYGNDVNERVEMLHTTRYLSCSANGSVLFGLCTYIPYPISHSRQTGIIVNLLTGETVGRDIYETSDRKILSRRQLEILSLIAKGVPSKQIADRLNISINTVNRHRQDILATLKVANTAAAVEIALRMNLI